MLTFRQNPNLSPTLFDHYGVPAREVLYFDIETTGLSADTSFIYLICAGFLADGEPTLLQWFSEGFEDEESLLHAFFPLLSSYRVLVHYNGTTFDIPYLEKKCAQYGLEYNFDGPESVDLYRMLKPYKSILSLNGCRQKDVEAALGISRKDRYDGGELIEIYKQYLGRVRYDSMKHSAPFKLSDAGGLTRLPSSSSEALLYLLLLHNAEDVEHLIHISCLLPALQVLNGCVGQYDTFTFTEFALTCTLSCSGLPSRLPASYTFPFGSIVFSDTGITVSIPYYSGELKYFFDNYKDYYYLPAEDCAVHKSVGETVDKAYRKNCTAANCYIKKAGMFLPQKDSRFLPEFKTEKKDKFSRFEVGVISDGPGDYAELTDYVNSLFR